MPVPLGFSVGDVTAVSILIKDVFKTLDNATGSVAEYQELSRALGLGSHTVRRVADQCKECIEKFLDKIKGYERSLGAEQPCGQRRPLGRVCDIGRKVRWGLTITEEVAKFRTVINAHSATINMLLITANVNLTNITRKTLEKRLEDAQTKTDAMNSRQLTILDKIQDKLDGFGIQLGVQGTIASRLMERLNYFFTLGNDLRSLMSRIWTSNLDIYNAVVDLQSRIPKEFGPCWIQEPLILTDALGRVVPIRLELISSWDVFEGVLAALFIDLPGHGKIARREYAIHEPSLERDIDRTRPFSACFLPGRRWDMVMVFKTEVSRLKFSSCPSCGEISNEDPLSTTQCEMCKTWFQRITDIEPVPQFPLNQSSRINRGVKDRDNSLSSREPYSKKRKWGIADFEKDDLKAFKRVRLLTRQTVTGVHNEERPRDSPETVWEDNSIFRESRRSPDWPIEYLGLPPQDMMTSASNTPLDHSASQRDLFVGSRVNPYRCPSVACEEARVASAADLFRHERKAQASKRMNPSMWWWSQTRYSHEQLAVEISERGVHNEPRLPPKSSASIFPPPSDPWAQVKIRKDVDIPEAESNPGPGRCYKCDRSERREWRRCPDRLPALCKACSLRYAETERKTLEKQYEVSNNIQETGLNLRFRQ